MSQNTRTCIRLCTSNIMLCGEFFITHMSHHESSSLLVGCGLLAHPHKHMESSVQNKYCKHNNKLYFKQILTTNYIPYFLPWCIILWDSYGSVYMHLVAAIIRGHCFIFGTKNPQWCINYIHVYGNLSAVAGMKCASDGCWKHRTQELFHT